MPELEDQIDGLYQLPLDQFTAARNALAKEARRPTVKDLEKPNIAAWAVNQLYWQHRADYDRLVQASERLRAEHRKLLAGKSSDIREAEKSHRDAVRAALDRIKDVLSGSGHAASDQTLNAVQQTLEALPSADPRGRLTKPLKPLGFEALAGVSITPGARPNLRIVPPSARTADEPAESPQDKKRQRELARQREKEENERKERQRQAEKELKAAEAAMLRAEDAVKKGEKELADLKAKRDEAVSEYQRARLRARE